MKKILRLFLIIEGIGFAVFTLAQGYKITVGLPSLPKGTEIRSPSEYISILFKFGLGIAGALALIVLLYSAIEYIIGASRGNVAQEESAKSRIFSVFLGLGLLLLSFLILYTINPDLVKLKMPKMKIKPIQENSSWKEGGGSWMEIEREKEETQKKLSSVIPYEELKNYPTVFEGTRSGGEVKTIRNHQWACYLKCGACLASTKEFFMPAQCSYKPPSATMCKSPAGWNCCCVKIK